jgi:hypothetical protein
MFRDLESDPLMKGEVLHNEVIDAYGPSDLLGTLNIVGGSLQLYRMLVSFFEENDLILPTVTPGGRAISQIAQHLFITAEDKADALKYAMRGPDALKYAMRGPPRAGTNIVVSASTTCGNNQTDDVSQAKIAQAMFIRFKDEDEKFTDVIDQSLSEFLGEYVQACNSVGVPRNQRLQHLHNLLGGEEKRFYNREIHDNYQSFEEAAAVLGKEYSSFPRPKLILAHLEDLRIQPLMTRRMTKSEALHHVWQEITRHGAQCPRSHRSDENKVVMLRTAVIGNSWARDPISRAATSPTTWHALDTQLEAVIQIEKEELAAKRKDTANYTSFTSGKKADALSDKGQRDSGIVMNGVHFQRYGRSIRGLSWSSDDNIGSRGPMIKKLGYPRADKEVSANSGCVNCGQPGYGEYSSKCQVDVDNVRINDNRVKWLDENYGAKQGVARVLHEISLAHNEYETFIANLPDDDNFDTNDSADESFVNFTRMMSGISEIQSGEV